MTFLSGVGPRFVVISSPSLSVKPRDVIGTDPLLYVSTKNPPSGCGIMPSWEMNSSFVERECPTEPALLPSSDAPHRAGHQLMPLRWAPISAPATTPPATHMTAR